MNILIVEDESLSARRLKTLVTEIDPTYHVLEITESIQSTVLWLLHHPMPDLMLMDIELTDGKSFDIFDQVRVTCPVIFVTAYDEYAIRAFKVNSIDYLLKPVKKEELIRAIDKLAQLRQQSQATSSDPQLRALLESLHKTSTYRDRFLIKRGDQLLPVETVDIAYIYTRDKQNYIRTHLDQEWPVDQTLDEIEKNLDPKLFFRANRQFILSARAVEKVRFWFSSKLKVDIRPKPDEEVIVSREKAMAFRRWMGE